MSSKICSFLAVGLISLCNGHSWLECSDYQAEFNGQDYDFANCQGYPRGYHTFQGSGSFSSGGGKTSSGSVSCAETLSSSLSDMYDSEYSFANYTPGSTYRLVWPAKNHAIGEECGETSSTDKAMAIYVNPNVNPTSDLTDISEFVLIHDWHQEYLDSINSTDDWGTKGVKGVPFANCEDYCTDTDASPCWGDFELPTDVFTESGFYTFLWYWEFGTLYVSCFEAYVDIDGEMNNVIGDSGNGDGNSGESDSSDDETADLITTYHAKVPIFYDGGQYDAELIVDALNGLFEGFDDVEWEITSYFEDTDTSYFNLTAETYTTSIVVVSAMIQNNSICVAIENAYNEGSCTIGLGGYAVSQFSVTSNKNNKNNGDNAGMAVLAVVIVLIIILLIVGGGIGYQKMQERKNLENGTGNAIGSVNSTQLEVGSKPQQTNIVSTND